MSNLPEERQAEASKVYGVELISLREVAKLYGLPEHAIRRMDRLKQIPSSVKYRGCLFWVKKQHVALKAQQDRARSEELKKVLGEAWNDTSKPMGKRRQAEAA
jgi:hypothetical protein